MLDDKNETGRSDEQAAAPTPGPVQPVEQIPVVRLTAKADSPIAGQFILEYRLEDLPWWKPHIVIDPRYFEDDDDEE